MLREGWEEKAVEEYVKQALYIVKSSSVCVCACVCVSVCVCVQVFV